MKYFKEVRFPECVLPFRIIQLGTCQSHGKIKSGTVPRIIECNHWSIINIFLMFESISKKSSAFFIFIILVFNISFI